MLIDVSFAVLQDQVSVPVESRRANVIHKECISDENVFYHSAGTGRNRILDLPLTELSEDGHLDLRSSVWLSYRTNKHKADGESSLYAVVTEH